MQWLVCCVPHALALNRWALTCCVNITSLTLQQPLCTNLLTPVLCTAAAATPISYSQHASLINAALQGSGVARGNKSTHICRDRGAELMNEMGCPLEDIQRAGGWKQDTCGTSYFVPALGPRSLLALGMWRVDGGHLNTAYYADHFRVAVLKLVEHMLPQLLPALEAAEAAHAAAAAGDKSQDAVAGCLPSLQVMLKALVAAIQNALVLADAYPDNLFIKDLRSHPKFE